MPRENLFILHLGIRGSSPPSDCGASCLYGEKHALLDEQHVEEQQAIGLDFGLLARTNREGETSFRTILGV
ncbi:hypothetical protein [Candidatus Nitrospira nitrificans]|uniref:Uncharacterized protein n=1 Tax=Candidatus Nitrospira nitrificans TaxID=1742973 RepID=A0A0S4LJX3_9BACT|nr:hypothetical protein [Candidatus Nitrospira nitrificans]CUS37209.1 hypothetical protein COMA2_30128 [Candidatus Nitrospira nitrificans]